MARRSPRALLVTIAVAMHVSSLPSRAYAQETTHGGSPAELGPPHADNLFDPAMHRSWGEGRGRPFAAVTVDAGYLYLRPSGHIGYGKPFNTWVGIEANPLVGQGGYGGYGGLRLALPYTDLRVGARWFAAFRHTYLNPQ